MVVADDLVLALEGLLHLSQHGLLFELQVFDSSLVLSCPLLLLVLLAQVLRGALHVLQLHLVSVGFQFALYGLLD